MRNGRLEVIYGPMFSGKSRELIRRLRDAARPGVQVVAFKSDLDDRHDVSLISTHDGDRFPCTPIRTGADFREAAGAADVVGLDEAQFFGDDLVVACLALVAAQKRVIVAGLHEDYLGEPFEPLPALIAASDESRFLEALCAVCGTAATHTHRIRGADERIVVGAGESYEARCSRCFAPASRPA